MKLVCLDCGELFDSGELVSSGEWHGEFFEPGSYCPACNSSSIEEAHQCPVCTTFTTEDNLVPGSSVCQSCYVSSLNTDTILRYLEENELFETAVLDTLVPPLEHEAFFKETVLRFLLDDKIKSMKDPSNPCTHYFAKLLEFIGEDASHFADWLEEDSNKKEAV